MSTTTKRGTRPRKSPEARQAEAQALHDTLTAQVEQLVDTGEWMRFLAFLGSFHAYSLNNLLLILAQRPDATMVAGFRQWQAKGRQVRKGERSIKIRGYSTKKITETDEETGDETERQLRRFPILSVFDISQTDPIEGAETPSSLVERLTGEDPTGVYDAMAAHMTAQGWTVVRETVRGGANGYTTTDGTRRLVIDQALEPAQAAKTMLHEAAHAVLHTGEAGTADPGEYVAHRGRMECEAESVAYVLAGLVDLDTSAYSRLRHHLDQRRHRTDPRDRRERPQGSPPPRPRPDRRARRRHRRGDGRLSPVGRAPPSPHPTRATAGVNAPSTGQLRAEPSDGRATEARQRRGLRPRPTPHNRVPCPHHRHRFQPQRPGQDQGTSSLRSEP